MAISNYGELQTALNTWMAGSGLSTSYENCTKLFEAVVNRGLPWVDARGARHIGFPRQMEDITTLTTSSGSVTVPSDYIAYRSVLYTGTTPYVELEYVHPTYLRSTWIENDSAGDPKIFTIEDGSFYARPVDDTASVYQFHYYEKITTLTTTSTTTNWLLTEYPDAYLEGVLTELFALRRNRVAAELHKARRDETFSDIMKSSAFTTGATSRMVRENEYF